MTGTRSESWTTLDERVMCAVPRVDGHEEMRVVYTRARAPDGREVAWHAVGLYRRDGAGQWRRTDGATIRGRELRPVVAAMIRAVAGSLPGELRDAARQIVEALTGGPA